jgi:acyl-homoserine-lactone acylase
MRAAIIALALPLIGLAACRDPGAVAPVKGAEDTAVGDPYDVEIGPYEADIRWTSWGIPHISAEDWGSVAYGLGYAFAGDHGCVLADQIVMVRSERTQFFGAGPDDLYLHQDIGWKALDVYAQAEAGWFALTPQLQSALVGYAAGFNRWVAEGDAPDSCAGAPWLRDVNHVDLLAYYLAFGLNGSGGIFVDAVGSAAPPNAPGGPIAPANHVLETLRQRAIEPDLGSNGWAIGRDRTEASDGMLLSNTHFPAEGERQWHESHLTIPGELDVYGASLMGVPIINVGFNEHVAWTHTVSMTPRFIAALLTLDPDDPTRYLYDGEYVDMEQTDHTVQVLQDDGSLEAVTRTTYRSLWGPVINAPVLGWNELFAVTFQDANDNNVAMADIWVAMNRAESLDDFETAHRDINAVPWVHTMAVDAAGTAWYADSASTPNWSAEAEAAYPEWLDSQPLAALFDDNGAPCVDGSDPVFHWVEEPGARVPGLVPFDDAPQMERTDFVYNANDNHWMTNPAAPLTGYPLLYGDTDSPRSPRTRMNAKYLMETGPDSASGEDGRFSLAELEAAALGGRGIFAELMLPDVLARCDGITTIETNAGPVDISPACLALAGWDGTVTTDARGAHVWREMLASDAISRSDLTEDGFLFEVPFDAADPIGTPRTVRPAPDDSADPLLLALADATLVLAEAGLPLDARLGDVQFMRKGDDDIGVGGGQSVEGTIAIANYANGDATLLPAIPRASVVHSGTDLTQDGYQINYGNSWVMAVEMTPDGPEARAVMTYSQSEDPRSEHFSDQTTLYGQGSLRPVLFREADIAADVQSSVTLTLP